MRSIRRKYIALSGAGVVTVLVILVYIIFPASYQGIDLIRYFGFTLIIIELLFSIPVYFSKNEMTKNMLTTMIWILTVLYFFMFIYQFSIIGE